MNKKLIVLAVVLGLLAVAYVGFFSKNKTDANATIYGNVDIREATLAFRSGGRVSEVRVDEGAIVKKGDVLAVLDIEPLNNSLHGATANLAALSARNSMMHSGYRQEDVEQAKAKVAAAEAALTNAEKQFSRQGALVAEQASTQHFLDDAKSARDQAVAQLKVAQQQALELQRGYRKEEIAESDAQLAQARANLATAELAVRDANLLAASDGIVLTRAIEVGTMVQAGTPAFNLSLTKPVWVRAYVPEPQLGYYPAGAHVLLSTDTRPGKPYHGVVGFVSPTAEFTPKSVETTDLRTSLVYRIRVVVEDADVQLRQGMPVTIGLAQ
ncbi:secretion protein HlyD [Undibacterium sp. Dicai25W]|uniref:secretion protein HlyD n=1 Tax=Undibacterium sp. Dicai25W TaxID=3413034 RepID=UPI003BF0A7F2